ncbi:sugar ABC transporter ATP-binding protein [Streptococcus dysgalactiae subsp. equisimilis 167]|nr:sugar ABC transporter ATP-binding protein [Streptococcus dysgalactiae subsp. equisimilis 167]
MVELNLNHIYKKYPNTTHYAVEDFDLDIKDKEFIVFVGPSGCGKSTTLRMIAGLEDISEGELKIDGEVVNDKSPKDRDIAMVFQNYALYPHMTVYDNMAFGLKLRKYKKDDIDRRVKEAAEILGLTEFLERKPADLSGGQRQRVAMGRAIVRDAKVFLMDEPLSNLDAKLRVSMRAEIAKIHRRIGSTTIYVTHDQTEAMTLADRIVIMSATKNPQGNGTIGKIEQVGSPQELYNLPANKFVAGFIGSPAMNFFEVEVKDGRIVSEDGLDIAIPEGQAKMLETAGYKGKKSLLVFVQKIFQATKSCMTLIQMRM